MLITVLTPAFNRADLLPRLYHSLCGQTNSDFEWIVVDDGSTDSTPEVVLGFIGEGKLKIKYIRKENGGKHTAINRGVKEAEGELVFIADSDDWLPATSVEKVSHFYAPIRGNNEFAGVCGLDALPDGKIIGNGLPVDIIDASYLEIRDHYNVKGDMKEVYKTSVLREFPFPEFDDERFCPEALIWNRIASKYKLRYFNDAIYIAEYQPGGITAGITRARMKNPKATMLTYAEWVNYNIPVKRKVRNAINYWRFALCAQQRNISIALWTFLFAPLGVGLHILDRYRYKC